MQKGIVVTGGGHGIGMQICRDFLAAGDQVCFMDFDRELGISSGGVMAFSGKDK